MSTDQAPATARVIALTGFLGAGKTTTMTALAKLLESRGERVSVVTNDQGADLVDTLQTAAAGMDAGEVTGGCFCCRFDDLASVVGTAVNDYGADTVLAEAVGSCTDITATVARPLRREHVDVDVAPVIVVVDPARYRPAQQALTLSEPASDLAYLFDRQLADADIAAVNKIDVMSDADVEGVRRHLRERHPHLGIVPYSAATGAGLTDLLTALGQPAPPERDLEIDYDRYAAAEARLAWLNHAVDIVPRADGVVPSAAWGRSMLTALSDMASAGGWEVGHVKVFVEPHGDRASGTKLSVVRAGQPPALDADGGAMRGATAWVNARVACEPDELDAAVDAAIGAADHVTGVVSTSRTAPSSFAPAYPRPQHRLSAEFAVGRQGKP